MTDKSTDRQTDRISSCRLDLFCGRGRVKTDFEAKQSWIYAVLFMSVRNIFIYRGCCVQSIFSENRFGGQTIVDNIHWIYTVLPMSVGPLRPRRAIFSCASIFPKN